MIAIIPLMGYALCRAEEFRDPSIDLSIPVVRAVRSSSVLSGGTARVAKVVQHPGPQGPRVPKHEFADRHPLRETVPRSTIIPDDREAVRVDRERPDGTIRCGLRQQQRRAAER